MQTTHTLTVDLKGQPLELAYQLGGMNADSAQDTRPVLVFIHGVLASVNFWPSCMPEALKTDYPWISLSLPAHYPSKLPKGFSAQDIDPNWFNTLYEGAFEQLLGDREFILIGHSTGGFAALNYATTRPKHLRGVVSVAGFYDGHWEGLEGALVKLAHLGKWTKSLFVSNLAFSRRIKPLQHFLAAQLAYDKGAYGRSERAQNMLAAIQGDMQTQPLDQLHTLFSRIPKLNIFSELPHIQIPTLVVAGTHDPVIPASQSLQLLAAIPNAQSLILDWVGHMPFMESAELFDKGLIRFIESINQNNIETVVSQNVKTSTAEEAAHA